MDTDEDPDAKPYPYPYTEANTHSKSYVYGRTYIYPDGEADADTDAYSDAYTIPDVAGNTYCDARARSRVAAVRSDMPSGNAGGMPMRTWTVEFDDVQADFEHWLRRVLNGDRIIVTVDGDPTAAIVPHEDYLKLLDHEAQTPSA